MVAPSSVPFTVREYLALEGVAEARHEFCGGRILAMAGADPTHNTIVHNLHVIIGSVLRDRPCRVWGSDQRVLVETIHEYFYPDLVVTCLDAVVVEPTPVSLTNPQIIIEVLSESTERYDRGDKWSAYRMIPTLMDYVMVSTRWREIDHHQRRSNGTWTLRTVADHQKSGPRVVGGDGTDTSALEAAAITLGSGLVLELAQIYRNVT